MSHLPNRFMTGVHVQTESSVKVKMRPTLTPCMAEPQATKEFFSAFNGHSYNPNCHHCKNSTEKSHISNNSDARVFTDIEKN